MNLVKIKRRIFNTEVLFVVVSMIVGIVAITSLLLYIFMDIWAFQNKDRPDIVARGSFLAGWIVLVPGVIASFIAIATIFILRFRKSIRWNDLIIGFVLCAIGMVALVLSGSFTVLLFPGGLISWVIPYGHYIYILILITIFILSFRRRIKKERNNAP